MPDFLLDQDPDGFARIKVVGVGGGGCNAVDSMFDLGLQNVEFYVINSDLQALRRSKCPNRIQIGAELTRGRGCGASPDLGEKCMLDAREEVEETLAGADVVFVTSGLGGGTGTGAAPVVAEIARSMGILTVAVVTRPFKFEGLRRSKSAEAGLAKLRAACDTMIVINNERLLEVVGPKVAMPDAFKVANDVLAQAVSSISDLVSTPGLINLDFEDIRTIMGGRGGAVMGVGVGKGENRAQEAVKKATSSPLLDKIVIDGATGVLLCVTGGPDMTLTEASDAARMIQEAVDPDAEVIFGAVIDDSLNDTMRVTLIATGFSDDVQNQQFGNQAMETVRRAAPAPQTIGGWSTPGPKVRATPERPAPAAQPPAPAPVSSVDSLDDSPLFHEMEQQEVPEAPVVKTVRRVVVPPSQSAPAPQPAPKSVVAEQPVGHTNGAGTGSTLRAKLEAMMAQTGKAEAPAAQPPIRVAKSQAAPGSNGGNHSAPPRAVPPKPEVVQEKVHQAASEPAPQVTLFDPEREQEEEKSDFDTPTFLRRRRSLFE